jgi:hypothetical protein
MDVRIEGYMGKKPAKAKRRRRKGRGEEEPPAATADAGA